MIPSLFKDVPKPLHRLNDPVLDDELESAVEIRRKFEMAAYTDPYMVDIIRAFRLVDDAKIYVEVGTRDKGNLAWVAPKLQPHSLMIDIDIDRFDEAEEKLRLNLNGAEYHRVTGDSISPATIASIETVLRGEKADAIFCDSSHMFEHSLAEFELYFPLLKSGAC